MHPPVATTRHAPLARDASLILCGSLVVALAAQARLDLPFTPVPITLQTAAVLLVGATLGARRGAAAVLAYLAQGAAGLPVFAGGAAGPAYALGPTGGYLVGFVLAAATAGWLVERGWGRDPLRVVAAFGLASASVYLAGVSWLALAFGLPPTAGLVPFVAVDAAKTVVAAALWSASTRLGRP